MKRYTISEIVKHNKTVGGHYFDRDTLKHFGQRQRDFHVMHIGERVFIYAQSQYRGWSIAEYHPTTGQVRGLHTPGTFADWRAVREYLTYVYRDKDEPDEYLTLESIDCARRLT